MNKEYIVKESRDFDFIINTGKKVSNNIYNIFYIQKENVNNYKFGLAVGKKIGNAVVRNKIKRQIRSIVRNNKFLFSKPYYYIIMVKKGFLNNNYIQNEKAFSELIEKVNK